MRINERKKDGKRETRYKRVWLKGDGGNEEREKCVRARTRFSWMRRSERKREREKERKRGRRAHCREKGRWGYLRACATVRI